VAEELSPSERELDVLKVLWEMGSGSVREVRERLLSGGLAFNTVQTLLRIMEEKGLVTHRAVGRTFIYSPKHSRERVASRFLNKVFDGALDEFVLTILRAKDADAEDLKELERLIAKARRDKQSRRGEGD
jgi:BlaI family transcriptional regulator, penicillinase repressor